MTDDDDIQEYERERDVAFINTFHQCVRNKTLEEVAQEFDKMEPLDTAASFAVFVRNMKK